MCLIALGGDYCPGAAKVNIVGRGGYFQSGSWPPASASYLYLTTLQLQRLAFRGLSCWWASVILYLWFSILDMKDLMLSSQNSNYQHDRDSKSLHLQIFACYLVVIIAEL